MNKLLAVAVLLVVAWLILRLALAVTSAFLHILWIVAIVIFVLWLINKIRGS